MGQQTSAPPAPPTSSPATAGGGGGAAVSPAWSRPDDASRQAQLDAMKRRATGLLALAVAVFVAARIFEAQYPWLGWVRATAEASLVGGLADWFAVTALFRHPLGLPIPHTAIVATRKERIGRILGNFVQNHFLSRDVIAANLRAVHPADRAARWLADPENSRRIARQVASGLAKTLETLPDEDVQALVRQVVSARLRATRVAPALGKTLAVVLAGNRQEELLNVAARSEEHTSELQSQSNLVCRLLLEKKKKRRVSRSAASRRQCQSQRTVSGDRLADKRQRTHTNRS